MLVGSRRSRAAAVALVVALVAVAALALVVRYADPLSSRVLAAEDPYTHIVFTREHMDRGYFDDSHHMGTTLYPPGMHAALGVFWSVSGIDPYAFMRLAAPLLGAFAAVGAFLLANRFGGLAAGVAAGVLTALIPEHVMRTNVFLPTAVDLALLPFFLWAVMEVLEGDVPGRRAWLAAAIVLGAALTFSHPWVVPLTALPLLLYGAWRAVLARRVRGSRASSGTKGMLVAAVALLALVALAFRSRWRQSGSGFGDFLDAGSVDIALEALVAVLNVWFVAVALVGGGLALLLARKGRKLASAVAASVTLALLLFITLPILTAYPPTYVAYGQQLGAVAIAAGVLGILVLPFDADNRVGQMGAALTLVTFPITAVNVFQSPFLPHRTVAYLAVGVALLGAGAVAVLAKALDRPAVPARRRLRVPTAATATVAAVALVALMLVGPAAARPEAWYRYYTDEEFEGFETVRDLMESDPTTAVLTGEWRPNMVAKTFAPELSRAWYSEEFFFDADARGNEKARAEQSGMTLYVVFERYEKEHYGNMEWQREYPVVWECACKTLTVRRVTGGP